MNLLRAGTVTVADLARSRALYEQWLDYEVVDQGLVDAALAASWNAPATAGAPYALLGPASKAAVYLRLVEAPPVPEFVPLVTYGWAALEFCVRDVRAVNERLASSPFEIIGPPRGLDGMAPIHAMQALGPDGEVCYFTQINDDLPGFRLPRAHSFIDRLFINVLASSDMRNAQQWLVRQLGFALGQESMEMVYTMLAKAFGTPIEQRYTLSTMADDKDLFLEIDQMPAAAKPRPAHAGFLPPGIAITTFRVASLAAVTAVPFASPAVYEGALYAGGRSVTVADPDGALFELVEQR